MSFGENHIGNFKQKFDGGTRPNRFVVNGATKDGVIDHLMVKAATMPEQSVGIMQVPFRGRVAKLPGDRVYGNWTFTVIDTQGKDGSSTRKLLRDWQGAFNSHKGNVIDEKVLTALKQENDPFQAAGQAGIFPSWSITQLGLDGKEIPNRTIQLVNCWPVEIGPIELSYDVADTLTEYTCTLAYDYLVLTSGSGVSTGGG